MGGWKRTYHFGFHQVEVRENAGEDGKGRDGHGEASKEEEGRKGHVVVGGGPVVVKHDTARRAEEEREDDAGYGDHHRLLGWVWVLVGGWVGGWASGVSQDPLSLSTHPPTHLPFLKRVVGLSSRPTKNM